ncbi:hypothetical protein [Methanosarcina barkeri]|uniref:hypothetical protein n=1 Tax=Methanosarcina barkeri TaxID=2208 RepID=UPI001FB54C09|nr:hypothetical protein [Methanosarcina barkeri]
MSEKAGKSVVNASSAFFSTFLKKGLSEKAGKSVVNASSAFFQDLCNNHNSYKIDQSYQKVSYQVR